MADRTRDTESEQSDREVLARTMPDFLTHHDEQMEQYGPLKLHLGHHQMHEEAQRYVRSLVGEALRLQEIERAAREHIDATGSKYISSKQRLRRALAAQQTSPEGIEKPSAIGSITTNERIPVTESEGDR